MSDWISPTATAVNSPAASVRAQPLSRKGSRETLDLAGDLDLSRKLAGEGVDEEKAVVGASGKEAALPTAPPSAPQGPLALAHDDPARESPFSHYTHK